MPVQGSGKNNAPRTSRMPPISPNPSGQMVSRNSNFNPRGQGKPRAQPATMPKGKGKGKGVQDYLAGDITYKSQLADLQRNLENYRTEYRGNVGDVNDSFADTLQKMQRERHRSLTDIGEDFAGRGLLHSGLNAKAQSDYNDEFNIRRNDLRTDQSQQLEDLLTNRKLFTEQTRTTRRNARSEALRRRAQKLGLTGL